MEQSQTEGTETKTPSAQNDVVDESHIRPQRPVIWVVVPCYNEEDTLPRTVPLFLEELELLVGTGRASENSRILFVNDGSADDTWKIISEYAASDERILGASLSRNRGHQNALMAGLSEALGNCDAAISADCDGQDDLAAMGAMVDEYLNGAEVVYGVRSSRDTDTAFKRMTAEGFYKLMSAMGADVVFNHADYRLLGSRALEGLAQFEEANLFLRGLVPLVGFETATVPYERKSRIAGESHYPLGKMIGLAIDGITSLSVKPMRIIMGCGFACFLVGIAFAIWAIVMALLGRTVSGWASTICIVSVIGGLQLLALGVIGEYIGKIYLETKRRPRWIIEERTWRR